MAVQTQLGVYEKLGVKRIINGWGTITRVGGSLMPPKVVEAMAEAARSFVDIDKLYLRACEVVARHTGAEAGLVTTGCAASPCSARPPRSPATTRPSIAACRTPRG